jgi:hypothetical protein
MDSLLIFEAKMELLKFNINIKNEGSSLHRLTENNSIIQ